MTDEFAWYAAVLFTADEADGSTDARLIDLGPADLIDELVAAFRSVITHSSAIGSERHLVPVIPVATRDEAVGQTAGAKLRQLVFDSWDSARIGAFTSRPTLN
jgi:hypothetical protein